MTATNAFSLIELLIVVAIMAILAGLLVPGLMRARGKAQKAACGANLHQLGIGFRSFVDENSVYPSIFGPTDLGHHGWWAIQIQREISPKPIPFGTFMTRGVWRCPTAPAAKAWTTGASKEPFFSYGYNAFGVLPGWNTNLLGLNDLPANIPARKLVGSASVMEPSVQAPADMMAIGDSIDGMLLFRRWLNEFYKAPAQLKFPHAAERHSGSINVLFCDGHVDAPSTRLVFLETNDFALCRWNRDHEPHREGLTR